MTLLLPAMVAGIVSFSSSVLFSGSIYLLMLLLFFIVSSYFTISGSILFSQVIKLLVPT
jgi:hypothetical protein